MISDELFTGVLLGVLALGFLWVWLIDLSMRKK